MSVTDDFLAAHIGELLFRQPSLRRDSTGRVRGSEPDLEVDVAAATAGHRRAASEALAPRVSFTTSFGKKPKPQPPPAAAEGRRGSVSPLELAALPCCPADTAPNYSAQPAPPTSATRKVALVPKSHDGRTFRFVDPPHGLHLIPTSPPSEQDRTARWARDHRPDYFSYHSNSTLSSASPSSSSVSASVADTALTTPTASPGIKH